MIIQWKFRYILFFVCMVISNANAQDIIAVNNTDPSYTTPGVIINAGAPSGLGVILLGAPQVIACNESTGSCCITCYEAWATQPTMYVYTPAIYCVMQTLPKNVALAPGNSSIAVWNEHTYLNAHTYNSGAITVNSQLDILSHENFRATIYRDSASTVSDYANNEWTKIISNCYKNIGDATKYAKALYDKLATDSNLQFRTIADAGNATLVGVGGESPHADATTDWIWVQPAKQDLRNNIINTIDNSNITVQAGQDSNQPTCQ